MPKASQQLHLITGTLLALALAAWLLAKKSTSPETPSRARADKPLSAIRPSTTITALKQEVAALTIDEVLAQLPEEAFRFGLFESNHNPRADLLFERLGALRGAGALDEIVRRYGGNAFSAYAIGKALSGWMAVDAKGASEALLEIAAGVDQVYGKKGGLGYNYTSIHWRGTSIVFNEGGDYFDLGGKSDVNPHGDLSVGEIFAAALHSATIADPDLGFSLLADDSLQYQFDHLVGSYANGLGRETEWLKIAQDLQDLSRASRDRSIADAIGYSWARWDIDAALGWYTERVEQGGYHTHNLTVSLLGSLGDRNLAVDWLERNFDRGFVTAEMLKDYAGQVRGAEIDGDIRRLVALPPDEKARERIISVFAMPYYEAGERRLRHPLESLNALIEAADLSPELASYWKSTVEGGTYIDKKR